MQYSLSNLNFFFILISIGYFLFYYNSHNNLKLSDEINSPLQLIIQIKGFFFKNHILSLCLAITLFSFAGIPPLIGFFAKQSVLSAALDKGYIFMVLIAIITSVIGAAYYLNIIKVVFFDENKCKIKPEFINILNDE
jgi:NADH-ubiquinone oxidoreductase chain 2